MKIKFKNTISVLIKGLFNLFELALLIIIILIYLLRSYGVQSFVAKEFTSYLEKELSTKISVNKVKLKSFKNFEVNQILIPDQYGDTILFIPKIKLDIGQIKLIGNKYEVKDLVVENALINIIKRKGAIDYNYEYLLSNFSRNNQGDSKPFVVNLNSISLKNCILNHADNNIKNETQKLDYHNFKLINLNSLLTNVLISQNFSLANINEFSFEEKNGFSLKKLSAKFSVDSSEINLSNLDVVTNNSHVNAKEIFYFLLSDTLKNNKVKYDVQVLTSKLGIQDFNYFLDLPLTYNSAINISSDISGNFNDLLINNLLINIGTKSLIKGNLNFKNISNIDNSQFDFSILQGDIYTSDLKEFSYFNDNGLTLPLKIPSNFNKVDKINILLNAKGKLKDLDGGFSVNSSIGALSGDFKLKENKCKEFTYTFSVQADDFNGNIISNNSKIERFNAKLIIEGVGIDANNVNLNIYGNLYDVQVDNYVYQDVEIKGKLKNQSFTGEVTLLDDLLSLNFKGGVDLNKSPYKFDFSFDVNHAYLSNLGLMNSNEGVNVAFKSSAVLQGSSFDDFSGSIYVNDINYLKEGKNYFLDTLSFYSITKPNEHHLNLKSKFFTIDLNGNYHFDNLLYDFNSFLSMFVPNILDDYEFQNLKDESVHFLLNVHDFSTISELFFPSFNVSNGSFLELNFSPNKNIAEFKVVSEDLSYENILLDKLEITSFNNTSFKDSIFNMLIKVDKLSNTDLLALENISLNTKAQNDEVTLNFKWLKNDSSNYGDFELLANFNSPDSMDFYLTDASVFSTLLGGWIWEDTSEFHIYNNKAVLEQMKVNNNQQVIVLEGSIGNSVNDTLRTSVSELNLNNITSFVGLNNEDFKVNGFVNAELELSSLLSDIELLSEIKLNEVEVNNYSIGEFNFNSNWDKEKNRFIISGGLLNENRKEELIIKDFYIYPENDQYNQLKGEVSFEQFQIDFINPFLPNEILSGLDGLLTGEIDVNGNLTKPLLNGKLNINQAKIGLTEFNTNFKIKGIIDVSPENIEIINARITDKFQTNGSLSAFYNHNNFSAYSFNIVSQFKDPFLVMNNEYENNPNYYGDAYITGFTNVSYDSLSGLSINVNAKTEDNTLLTIPLYGSDEIVLHDFISFKNPDSVMSSNIDVNNLDDQDFNLNIDLDVTESAEIQLVFDEMVGDIMRAKGNGNIRLDIDKHYELSMFGTYEVSEGDYSFTLKDFINKKFNIEPGGEITWYGNPYNAHLDIYANYPLKTSLKNIMPPIDQGDWTHKSEVNVKIHLLNDLMNPDVSFGIELPKSSESARTTLKSLVSNEEQMNKQVFSLMILNKFIPQNPQIYSDNSNKINGASTTEALGNQLGNMISSFTDEFEVGFNYSVGDLITNNELSLAMSTQQFNDRLKINTNLGMSQANELSRNPSSFIGDVDIEYKVSPIGNFRVHVFNESNEYDLTNQNQANYTQGIGAFYKQNFNSAAEFLCELANLFKSKSKKCKDCSQKERKNKG